MTREEQIKQAARDIALNWNVGRGNEFYYRLDKLTEMARWADEHPKSPWKDASVEKPPYDTDCDDETSVYVIVRQEQGNVFEAYYDYDNNEWRDREHNWRLQDPTHWMLIPEV